MSPTDTLTAEVIDGMPIADYVAGDWLTHSRARKLLAPSCPAKVKWELDHPELRDERKPEFDQGKVAHHLVLGDFGKVTVVEANDWRTAAARAQRDEAYEAGVIPVLAKDYQACQDMAAAVLSHPIAGALFSDGKPEQVIVWPDRRNGVKRAARLDWLPNAHEGKKMIIPDLKSCVSADRDSVSRKGWDYGYASQAAWNIEAVIATGRDEDPAFCDVFVEKEPPYLVDVWFWDDTALKIGDERNWDGICTWIQCNKTGVWPSHNGTEVGYASLPAWIERRYEERI